MSIDSSTFLGSSNDLPGEPDDLAWLAALLREMMAAVAEEEGDTFRKAGMIARLSGLFLRAGRAAELKRANKELARRNAELEERLDAFESGPPEREMPLVPLPAGGPAEGGVPAYLEPIRSLVTATAPGSMGPFSLAPGANLPEPLVAGAPSEAAAPT